MGIGLTNDCPLANLKHYSNFSNLKHFVSLFSREIEGVKGHHPSTSNQVVSCTSMLAFGFVSINAKA